MKSARFTAALRLNLLEARDVPATLLVDDSFSSNQGNKYTTIQAAVDAAEASNGADTIRVFPGTYTEQVTITDDDKLTLKSVVPLAAVIKAPADLDAPNAIVHVAGADDVTLAGFTITGPGGTAGDLDVGVLVDGGGTADVRDNWVKDIRDNPLGTAGTGVGIQFGSSPGGGQTSGSGSATGNLVTGYQKGGIVANGPESEVDVIGNVVLGAGPTGQLVQNGIQVGFGAEATVSRNFVAGNDYTGAGFAAGIYLVSAGETKVQDNFLVGNQIGILVDQTTESARVEGNDIFGGDYGINVFGGSGAEISRNTVRFTDADGILIEAGATGVEVKKNTVTDSGGNGIALVGASGNTITGNTVRRSGGGGPVRRHDRHRDRRDGEQVQEQHVQDL